MIPFENDHNVIYNGHRPVKELLKLQSKGKYLTPDEKKRVTKYAEETRKQRKK